MSGLNGQTESNQENIAFSSLLTYRPTQREKKKEGREGKKGRSERGSESDGRGCRKEEGEEAESRR